MKWYVSGGKRFYVIDVLGYHINPAASNPGAKPPTRSYSVLDKYYNHREVASFYSNKGVREAKNQERAMPWPRS